MTQTLQPPPPTAARPRRTAKPAVRDEAPPAGQMELRRFTAPTMSLCLDAVKNELGTNAVILATRNVATRRWLGLLKREHVEITAGQGLRMPRRPQPRPAQATRPRAAAARKPGEALLESTGGAAAAYLGVQKEVGQLRELVGELVDQVQNSRTPHLPDDASPIFRRLLDAGVSQCHASAVIKEAVERRDRADATDRPALDKLVHKALAERLAEAGPSCRRGKGKPTVIALVGPTGVGKTTTVAKLAANLKLKENATVALVTIDTYRIAAIDQLKKYADIIDAPLAVVSEPREVKDAIARVADHDFVIIDTAGRSPRDAVKLAELDEFLTAADPAEVHLVLSANHGAGSLKMALKRFAGLRTDRLCFTKLDEAAELGALVDVAAEANLPLSYVTHGQNVPADIEPACAKRLASLILEAEAETPAAAVA